MLQLVGYSERKGEFTPEDGRTEKIKYDNIVFSFVTDENEKFRGLATEKDGMRAITISRSKFTEITGKSSPEELKGKEVKLHYGVRYGKPVLVKVEIVK